MDKISPLKTHPISQVVKSGYINLYSHLSSSELRAIHYKEIYKVSNPTWDETQVLLSKEFRKHFGGRGASVLDAGCGNGNFIIDENRAIINWACGVDLKQDYTSKNVCLDEIKYANLNAIPYPDNSFDAVVSLWVVEHLEQPLSVFKELYRVLKPNGLFLFATPNKKYLPLLLNQFLTKSKLTETILQKVYGRQPEDVFKAFYKANTLEQLTWLAKQANFQIEKLDYNYDPAYTSFNTLTYTLSSKLATILENRKCYLNTAHIAGIFKKKL